MGWGVEMRGVKPGKWLLVALFRWPVLCDTILCLIPDEVPLPMTCENVSHKQFEEAMLSVQIAIASSKQGSLRQMVEVCFDIHITHPLS